MRTIEYTTQFKCDYKREIKGKHKAVFSDLFVEIIDTLARDEPLAAKHRDHALSNNWQDHRDCHVKPDLILIYRKPDTQTLQKEEQVGQTSLLELKKVTHRFWWVFLSRLTFIFVFFYNC